MCGIAACRKKTDETAVRRLLNPIRHRGPDGTGVAQVGPTWLGHVRLAIVDVTGGHQPMGNERGDIQVAFNGEIYNHLDLRHPIENRHQFRTRSDTEVLVHLYEEYGANMLPRLDGMFALALAGPDGLRLLREACEGLLPLAILGREKMKFSDGAGSGAVVPAALANGRLRGEAPLEPEPGLRLRSAEEAHYYRSWKDVMPHPVPTALIGRTLDRSAATA